MPYLEFLRQEYWDGLPFPSLVDHVLSEVFTMTHQSWVALHSMAHSFTELHKPLHQTPPWRGFMQSFMCNLCTCMCCWAVVNVYSPVFSTTTKEQNLPIIAESYVSLIHLPDLAPTSGNSWHVFAPEIRLGKHISEIQWLKQWPWASWPCFLFSFFSFFLFLFFFTSFLFVCLPLFL